ncbi:MAG: hypothetical protein K2I72_02100 [Bacilli bacterium]|nr:hypothetical protein [Bacilli bacterium]
MYFDLGILYSLKDAINYANHLTSAKYADDEETKLNYLKEAKKVIQPTLYCDYGYDGSRRLEENMKKTAGLNV